MVDVGWGRARFPVSKRAVSMRVDFLLCFAHRSPAYGCDGNISVGEEVGVEFIVDAGWSPKEVAGKPTGRFGWML